jgi:hypothetical protein
MAVTHQEAHRIRLGTPSPPARDRHQGRWELAEVVPIRPLPSSRGGESGGMVSRIAQVFASLRAQAASGGTPPCPPTPPAPFARSFTHAAAA